MKKVSFDNELMKGICPKCPHYNICEKICRPVQIYLSQDNLAVFEKKFTNEDGETVSILYSRSRELALTGFKKQGDTSRNRSNNIEQAFSTENDSPFSHYHPTLKQTKLFIDKFFFKLSIDDLSVKYDMTPQKIYEYYAQAKRRLFDVLEALDSNRPLNLDHYRKRIEAKTARLPKGQKWFLLNKLFGLLPKEIAELENVSADSISAMISRVDTQIKAGEINLFDFSEKEAEAAKARLDAQRKKRRERHAKKKQSK